MPVDKPGRNVGGRAYGDTVLEIPDFTDHGVLTEYFGATTAARGLIYADQDRVQFMQWSLDRAELAASCRGSQRDNHRVKARFEIYQGQRKLLVTDCTCPVRVMCTHGAALVLAAARRDKQLQRRGRVAQMPPQWRAALAGLVTAPPADEGGGYGRAGTAPIAIQVEFPEPSPQAPEPEPVLRLLTRDPADPAQGWLRANITWAALLAEHTHLIYDPADFDQRQLRAVRALARAAANGRGYMARDTLGLTLAPPDVWELLDEAVEAGVEVIPQPGLDVATVIVMSHGARMGVRVVRDGADGLVVRPHLMLDGDPTPADRFGLIGSGSPHGLYAFYEGYLYLGRFWAPPTRTALDALVGIRELHIPADDVAEFTMEFLPAITANVDVAVGSDVLDEPTIEGPVPLLNVHIDDVGARVDWQISYVIDGHRREFSELPEVDSRRAFRESAAEAAAWDEARDAMEQVARTCASWREQAQKHFDDDPYQRHMIAGDAPATYADAGDAISWSGPDLLAQTYHLSETDVAILLGEVLPTLREDPAIVIAVHGEPREYRPSASAPVVGFHPVDELPGGADDPDNAVIDAGSDWLNLHIRIDVDGHAVPLREVLLALAAGHTHMLLADGTYFSLQTPELAQMAELMTQAGELGEIDADGAVRAGVADVSFWDELLELGVVDRQLTQWRKRIAALAAATPPEPTPVPPTLRAQLRDYQRRGLDWLRFLWDNQIGGILADDMGLGKTVQTLALMAHVGTRRRGPFLVIAPTSVVGNWVAECAKFVPDLSVAPILATRARAGRSVAEQIGDADIVITSYTLMRLMADEWDAFAWAGVVFDEAQFVKNHQSKTHQVARRLDAPVKLAITGTPMENNLMELWALLSLTAPGLFPSPTTFTERFRKPIESGTAPERLDLLRRRMRPFMLRRNKSEVAAELPPKQEQVLTLALAGKHDRIYQTRITRERQKVLGLLVDWENNKFEIFRTLTMLRQLSLHAGLVSDEYADVASAKVDYLAEQLPTLTAEGHSALVFSQFTGFLRLIRTRLDALGIAYSYLDGSLDARARTAAITDFRNGTTQVFLISLKAGGFGLNLTEADYCFVCDPWWNPAAEAQAVDRAHRIGQTRSVTVYRLVSAGTIEENVVALQEKKRELFSAVIEGGDGFGAAITARDIRELLAPPGTAD